MVIRSIVVAPGPYADTDWLDPAVPIPDNARRFRVLGPMRFSLRGRATSAPDAAIVSLGVMTVDAYVLAFDGIGGRSRGKTIVEVEGSPLASQIMIASSGLPIGATAVLHLTLAAVSAPVVEVLLLEGGRPL